MKVTDQIGNTIKINTPPQRVVSLVPSITYSLSSFGLDREVKGITRFCKWPAKWKKEKNIIGGTKNLKLEVIKNLKPDLILANKEENTKEEIEFLSRFFPVYVSDIKNLDDNILFLEDLGKIFHKPEKALEFTSKIKSEHSKRIHNPEKLKKAVYLIWKEPWMSVGGDTYIHRMLEEAGFKNIFSARKRYPAIDLQTIKKENPEYILLASEPYPFKEKHKKELEKIFPKSKILLVQGEAFTWFGTYTLQAYPYFQSLKKSLSNA